MKPIIAPSILSADFLNLAEDIKMINSSEADWFHVDVMDGAFVPNISFGFPIIKAIKSLAGKPLDVHLMIVKPGRFLEAFAEAGANNLTVHYEACIHLHRIIQAIKALKMTAGVAINPHTSVHLLENVIADIDVVCLMSVDPGFGGQKFIENSYSKITALKDLIIQKKSSAKIEIDGGVDLINAPELIRAGADILVAGNTVFSSEDPSHTISLLKETKA